MGTACKHIGPPSSVCAGTGGKGVLLVIFRCLEPLIETSEAVLHPSTPRREFLGPGPGERIHRDLHLGSPLVYLLSPGRSDPVTHPHGEGESSGEMGPGPPLAGTQEIPPLIWRTEHPTSGNLTTSGAGEGGQVFHFPSRCLAKVLRKKRGGGRVHRDEPEIPQEKTGRGGHTERKAPGPPHCPGRLALRTTDSGCPGGRQAPTSTASETPPSPLSFVIGETEAQGRGHTQGHPGF